MRHTPATSTKILTPGTALPVRTTALRLRISHNGATIPPYRYHACTQSIRTTHVRNYEQPPLTTYVPVPILPFSVCATVRRRYRRTYRRLPGTGTGTYQVPRYQVPGTHSPSALRRILTILTPASVASAVAYILRTPI
jgi:hypothetical protein